MLSARTTLAAVVACVVVALSVADVVTTAVAISYPGGDEGNPLPAWIMANHGEVWAYAMRLGSASVLAVACLLSVAYGTKTVQRTAWASLAIITLASVAVVANNALVIRTLSS